MGRFILVCSEIRSERFPCGRRILSSLKFAARSCSFLRGSDSRWHGDAGCFSIGAAWACLLFFAFLTAAFVCVGRVWRGDLPTLTPRYTTFGAFCIVANCLASSAFSGLQEDCSIRPSSTFLSYRSCSWTQGFWWGFTSVSRELIGSMAEPHGRVANNPLSCSGETAFSRQNSHLCADPICWVARRNRIEIMAEFWKGWAC